MFNDGFTKRLAGVLREYAANVDATHAEKYDHISIEMSRIGAFGDLCTFYGLFNDTRDFGGSEKSVEESTILYSSSLTDGGYLLLPGQHEGGKSCITCKCVHCENGTLLDAMTAQVGPDSITVSALCEDCGKKTEVYFVGVGRITTLNEGETCEPSEMPTKDLGNIA
ncbi:hypothetical protein MUP79_05465 [Candidatus Bathyarchaeota archaeon]|nr:hypothetical protein [Candidatus Bathyarchaeota archaeon]